jgi:hypothetical protein
MMDLHRLVLLICVTLPFSLQSSVDFQSWITQNAKEYKRSGELEARARIFSSNARLVEEHNSKDTTFKVSAFAMLVSPHTCLDEAGD